MANPFQNTLSNIRENNYSTTPITTSDVINKTGISLTIVALVGLISFYLSASGIVPSIALVIIGGFTAIGIALYAAFKKKLNSAPVALSFAFFEGLFVGGATFLIAYQTNAGHILGSTAIISAIAATVGIAMLMLFLYKARIIKVTAKFQMIVAMITVGILVASLIAFGLALIGIGEGLRTATLPGLLFSLFVIVIASLNYASDFKYIDDIVNSQADKDYAWGDRKSVV